MRFALTAFFLVLLFAPAYPLEDAPIAAIQRETGGLPLGEKIALWADKFVGVPYDADPLGRYVTERAIVSDEAVDCMYLVFRAVELALSRTPKEAVEVALEKRFQTKGVMKGAAVLNYDERYQYGEDMIDGGKWGREITAGLAGTVEIEGSRGREKVGIIPKDALLTLIKRPDSPFVSGDMVFFIKAPAKRVVGEIVGHIGILKKEAGGLYLIHASGRKGTVTPDGKGSAGEVKKVLFFDYASDMSFVGIRASRF